MWACTHSNLKRLTVPLQVGINRHNKHNHRFNHSHPSPTSKLYRQANTYPVSNLGSKKAGETFNKVKVVLRTVFLCLLSKLEKQNHWQQIQSTQASVRSKLKKGQPVAHLPRSFLHRWYSNVLLKVRSMSAPLNDLQLHKAQNLWKKTSRNAHVEAASSLCLPLRSGRKTNTERKEGWGERLMEGKRN